MFGFLRNTWIYTYYKIGKAKLALSMYGNPAQDMFVIGITGTNGKTTSSFMIHHIFNTLVGKSFLIGTNEIKIGGESQDNPTKMTALDPFDLQPYLAKAHDAGCKVAVLEMASHGLAQHRFYGIDVDMGILTNITPEHLDYHHTMEEYAEIKKLLFSGILANHKPNKIAIFPKDDKYGKKRAEEMHFDRMMSYSVIGTGTLKAENITYTMDTSTCDVIYMGKAYPCTIPLVGVHNIYNLLTALCAGLVVGLDLATMIGCLSTFVAPKGRMQHIPHGGVDYFIDFAHTPDGLDKALQYCTSVPHIGRVIVLTGAMGGRDMFKRPDMGAIAHQYADIIVLSDEDPDQEDRLQIIRDIRAGIPRVDGDRLAIIPDRRLAIQYITQIAQPGDVVLLAGKGHEQVMCTLTGRIVWDEKTVLEELLSSKM